MFLIEFAGLLAPGEDVGGVGSRVEVVLVWVVFRSPIDLDVRVLTSVDWDGKRRVICGHTIWKFSRTPKVLVVLAEVPFRP